MILQATYIDKLNPVIPPDPIIFTPVTIGWFVLAFILLVLLIIIGWFRYKKWLKNKYRHDAIKTITNEIGQRLLSREQRAEGLMELSELLKTVAFQSWPRQEVAGLSGIEWVTFLTKSCRNTNFLDAPGSLLQEMQYMPSDKLKGIGDYEIIELLEISKKWIGGHHV